MQKIPTLFLRNPENMKLVTMEVNPEAAWVLAGEGKPTIKRDGTNAQVRVINGYRDFVWKRRNPTREQKLQGAEPTYIPANQDDPAEKPLWAAVNATDFSTWPDGEWPVEVLGPKSQGGVESSVPYLYPFTLWPEWIPLAGDPRDFYTIHNYLAIHLIEGIVWHHPDGRMSKIKRRDFGLPWPPKRLKDEAKLANSERTAAALALVNE